MCKMGKANSKLKEEVIINNNAGTSGIVGSLRGRVLSDFEIIVVVILILLAGFIIARKIREYLSKTIRRQVIVQNV